MASKNDRYPPSDLTVCSICFEKFRTPRILPCTHVFCHGCISSYIISSCQSKEASLGFSCPLCRKFVPSFAAEGNPAQWADGLPICKILDKLNKGGNNLCAACLRENEEEEATDICITCEESICQNCSKYHKRNISSRHHVVKSLKEPNAVLRSLTSVRNDMCPMHSDKEVELYCDDHDIVCCSLCASTEHRKCADVTIIKVRAEKTKKSGEVPVLQNMMADYKHRLLKIKKNQEENLEDVNTASDRISEETRKFRKEINDHLDELENKHLNELARVTKKCTDMLSKTIDSVSDGIFLSDHYMNVLSNLENATDTCFVREYKKVKEGIDALKNQTVQLKEHKLKLESTISKAVIEIKNVKCFSSIKVLDTPRDLFIVETLKFSLSLVFEFDVVPFDDINCGVLSHGRLTLAKFGSSKVGLQQFLLEKDTNKQTYEYQSFSCFFGLVLNDNFFYATDRNANCVTVVKQLF